MSSFFPSIMKSIKSAFWIESSIWSLISFSNVWPFSLVRPAVSTSQKLGGPVWWLFIWKTFSMMLSLVVPEMSDVMALRLPINALKSVDFPTFGRPMMVTVGSILFKWDSRQ